MEVNFTTRERKLPFIMFDDAELGQLCKAAMIGLLPGDQNLAMGAISAANLLKVLSESVDSEDTTYDLGTHIVTVTKKC